MNSIGLTISDNHAVMVLVKKELRGDPSLENYRLLSLGEVNPEDREEILLSNIEGFIDENRGDRDNLFLSIPGSKVIFKKLSLPSPTEENLEEVLGFEMDRYTPFTLEEIYFDYKIVKRDEARNIIHVLLIVVKKEALEYYLNLLKRISVKVRGIEVTSTALYNVTTKESSGKRNGLDKRWIAKSSDWLKTKDWGKKLLTPWDRFLNREGSGQSLIEEGSRFLVNIDNDSCEIGVVRASALVYSRCFNLSPQSSEAGSDEGVEERADEILSGIETTRLSLTDDNPEIHQFMFSGNGVDQSLIDHLKSKESIDAQLLDDLNIKINTDDAREKIHCLSAAVGLALKGLKGVALDVNLIPRGMRPKKKKNWRLICGVTMMVLFLLGISSFTVSFFVKERMYLSGLSERVSALKVRVKEVEKMQEEIAGAEGTIESLEKIKGDDISKLKILKELTQIIPEEIWLTRFSYNERKGKKEIEISGYADTASEIIPILEESKFFEDVKFKSSIVKDRKSNKEKMNVMAVVSEK